MDEAIAETELEAIFHLLGELSENDKQGLGLSEEESKIVDGLYARLFGRFWNDEKANRSCELSERRFKAGFACWHCGHIEGS